MAWAGWLADMIYLKGVFIEEGWGSCKNPERNGEAKYILCHQYY
jgi:hypothetical protein